MDVKQLFTEIMKLADADAASELSSMQPGIAHQIYTLARDGLDILLTGMTIFRGVTMSDTTIKYLVEDQLIFAIKQCRTESGLGLREAKDLCEAYRNERIRHQQPTITHPI